MNRRLFLGGASAVLGAWAAPALARAALLPADAVFGRAFDTLQGVSQPLSDYQGRPVVLNFWASWCAPCVREMPLLESIHHQQPELALVGLAIDTRANVQRFLEKIQVSYPLLLTGTQGIPLMRDLGNKSGGLPFTAFFNRQGRLVSTAMGELKPEDLQARVRQIL
ncbi:TlpA family protein disulfide reductase [Castellaniella hirudinis]|uniref:TlpA family protein disulfide reductase n=1 Tax=Castellaniella hirudinis TaxID=1144617 RepID=UPI0039C2FBC2